MTPEGERIELFENSATNLTFTQDAGYRTSGGGPAQPPAPDSDRLPSHPSVPAAGKVAEAKAWYTKMFGGVPGKRSNYDAVDLPGVNFNFSEAPKPTVPLKGRMLSPHRVRGPEHRGVLPAPEGLGVTLNARVQRARAWRPSDDPWGTWISLSQGLESRGPLSPPGGSHRVRHLWSGLTVACAAALIGVTVAPLGSERTANAVGRSRPQGTYTNLYETARRSRGPTSLRDARSTRSKARSSPTSGAPSRSEPRCVPRAGARARQLVAGQSVSRSRQPGLAGHRSA